MKGSRNYDRVIFYLESIRLEATELCDKVVLGPSQKKNYEIMAPLLVLPTAPRTKTYQAGGCLLVAGDFPPRLLGN